MCASTQSLASMGRGGDTELAHVNPQEKAMLIKMGGSGTTNPRTGLREYYAPPAPSDAETFNSGNRDEIIKKLNEKFPSSDKEKASGVQKTFKYNPDTDSFDPYVTFSGKEYTASDFNNTFGEIMDLNIPSLSGSGSILSDIVSGIKDIDLSPDLDLVKEVQEGVESAKDFMEGTQDIVHVVQEGVNPLKILQNPKKELIDDPLQRYRDWETKTKEDWKETKEKFDAQNQESADDFSKMLQNLGGTMTDVITGASTSATNMVNLAHDDLIQTLVAGGLITLNDDDDGPGNAQAILEGDPRMLSLLTRRRQARKRGKAQLRKGGGLYIPLKTGIQVPAA